MNILVTGGGGFLGQALCRGLVERGHEVASFNRSHYPVLDTLGIRQIRGDLADRDAVMANLSQRYGLFYFYAQSCGACASSTATVPFLAAATVGPARGGFTMHKASCTGF